MENTITLDTDTLTSEIDTNNFMIKTTSELILIGFIGMTILFATYIFQNPTKDNFIFYTIVGFMIIISFGVGYSYYFQKKVISDTLSLIETATPKNDEVATPTNTNV